MQPSIEAPVGPSLERHDDVYLLRLGSGENRFTPPFLDAVSAALDEIEYADGRRSLVTHALGKTWSLGLDLDWIAAHPDEVRSFVTNAQRVMARMLTLPAPAVAAV